MTDETNTSDDENNNEPTPVEVASLVGLAPLSPLGGLAVVPVVAPIPEPAGPLDLRATLQAGPAGELFQRIMASPNEIPPQFVSAHRAIEQAAASDDPNLQRWAEEMRTALERTAEAEALEQAIAAERAAEASRGFIENIKDSITDYFRDLTASVRTSLADGFQLRDLSTIFNAIGGSTPPDPRLQQIAAHRSAAENAMTDGEAWLRLAEDDAVTEAGADNDAVNDAISRIDGIAPNPSPPPSPGSTGPSGP